MVVFHISLELVVMGGGKKTAASGLNDDVGAAVLVLVSFTESELSESDSESEDIRFWKADII